MLLTQHIKVSWYKECRGAPYTTIRNQMPQAYLLSKGFFDYNPLGYPGHYMYLRQTKEGLTEMFNRKDTILKDKHERIGAIEMIPQSNDYELRYNYDHHRAIPARRKYNPETCLYVGLNEQAMILQPNEYGRIIYNGRFTDYDSGNWYYDMDVLNVINLQQEEALLNVFQSKEPDKVYTQVKFLR